MSYLTAVDFLVITICSMIGTFLTLVIVSKFSEDEE